MRFSRGALVVLQVLVALATGATLPALMRQELRDVQQCLTSRMHFSLSPVMLMMAILIVLYPFSTSSMNPLPVDGFLQIGTLVLVTVVWLSIILLQMAVTAVQVQPSESFDVPEPRRYAELISACLIPAERPPKTFSRKARGEYAFESVII